MVKAPEDGVMRRRDTALAVLVALLWGTNFVAIRTGIDSVPPFLFLAVRFVVVCIPAVFLVRRPGLHGRAYRCRSRGPEALRLASDRQGQRLRKRFLRDYRRTPCQAPGRYCDHPTRIWRDLRIKLAFGPRQLGAT